MLGSTGSATALIVEWFIKTTILLAPALIAAAIFKRRTAAFRHFLLSFALIGLLLVPVLSLLPVGWRTPLLPARPSEPLKMEPAASEAGFVSSPRTLPGSGSTAFSETADRLAVPILPAPRTETRTEFSQIPVRSGFEGLATALSKTIGLASEERTTVITDGAILFIWLGGLALLLLRLAYGLAGAARMTREGTRLADSGWRILLQRFLSIVSLRRTVLLKSHPDVLVPMTWGWRKPVILLPAGAGDWAETERSAALFHELSHIKRADYVFLLLVRLSLSLFWWNPLCWVAYARIRREQEIACDELVLRAGIKPSTYAAGLLAFRRSAGLRWNPSAALPGLLGKSSFQERLAAILKHKQIVKEVKMKARISIAAAVVLAVALIGMARPATGTQVVMDPASQDVLTPGQEVKTAVAVEQQKEKEKAKVENKIVVDTAKKPVEVLVYRDGKVEKLLMDKPLTVTSGKEGQTIILGTPGGKFEIVEGKPGRLEIKEGQVLQLGEGETFTLDKDGGKIVITQKKVDQIVSGFKVDEKNPDVKIVEKVVTGKEGVKIAVRTGEKGDATAVWKVVEPRKGSIAYSESGKDGKATAWTVVKPAEGGVYTVEGKDGKTTAWTVAKPAEGGVAYTVKGKDGKAMTWASADKVGGNVRYYAGQDGKILDQIKQLREQAAAIKAGKLDIAELEKSLEKLEEDLKTGGGSFKLFTPGENLVFEGKKLGSGAYFLKEKIGKLELGENATFISDSKKGSIAIVLTGKTGAEGKASFDRAVEKLKSSLPEGFTLDEAKFDEESGAMTIRLQGPADRKIDTEALNKIVEGLREEIKK